MIKAHYDQAYWRISIKKKYVKNSKHLPVWTSTGFSNTEWCSLTFVLVILAADLLAVFCVVIATTQHVNKDILRSLLVGFTAGVKYLRQTHIILYDIGHI